MIKKWNKNIKAWIILVKQNSKEIIFLYEYFILAQELLDENWSIFVGEIMCANI